MSGFDIYCGRCGLKNSVESSFATCEICHAPLNAPANEQEFSSLKVFALDMKKLSFGEVVSSALGWRGALSRIPFAPFVAWRIYLKRRKKEPWIRLMFKHQLARFSRTSLDDISGIDKGRLSRVTVQLARLGFEPAMDIIFESGYIPLSQRIFINVKKAVYATLTFYPTRGGVWLSVMAELKNGEGLVSVSDMRPDYLKDPKGRRIFIPGAGINGLLATLDMEAPYQKRCRDKFGLERFLIELASSHRRIFDHAVKTELLIGIEKSEASYRYADDEGLRECANHAGVMAVRKCDVCGKTLCGVCNFYDIKNYCEDCLPEHADRSSAPPIDFSGELRPAGFFIRGSVRLLELALFLWLAVALFPSDAQAGSRIAYQIFFLTGFIAYFLFFVSRYGATPLQRVAGISVIDSYGERLMFSSVLTRTIYLFGSLITFLPALGYLPALWDKYKRGWHDRMSGTMVITTNPKVKEMIGVVALAVMLTYGGLKAPEVYQSVIDNLTLLHKRASSVIVLPREWSKRSRGKAILDKRRAVGVVGGKILSLNVSDGSLIWKTKIDDVVGVFADRSYGFYFATGKGREGGGYLSAINGATGNEIWRIELATQSIIPPISHQSGVFISDGSRLINLSRSGREVWSVTTDSPLKSIYPMSETVLVTVQSGASVYVYNRRDGNPLSHNRGYGKVTPVSLDEALVIGKKGTAMIDGVTGKVIWSIPERLAPVDNILPSRTIFYTLNGARNTLDGAYEFRYPPGCVHTGAFKGVAVLYCSGHGDIVFINRFSGDIMGRVKSGPLFRSKLLAEINDHYHLLTLERRKNGDMIGRVVSLSKTRRHATISELGIFREEPLVEYLADQNRLFVSTESSFGVYRTPWDGKK